MEQEFREFWHWFEVNEAKLRDLSENGRLARALGKRLTDLGFFDWEIGPSDPSGECHYLSIQLSEYDEEGVKFRDKFLSLAPDFTGWDFLTSRPPKQWSRQLVWGKIRVPIFAGDWQFSLYKYDDGKFDIVLNTKLPDELSEAEKRSLAICVLASELGDAVLYEKVNAIGVEEKKQAEIEHGILLGDVGKVLLDNYRSL